MKDISNKKFWEKVAKVYAPFQEKANKDLYETLCQKIKPFFKKEQKVLELACGTGQLTAFLADNSNSWIATDFSEKMVEEAKKRLNKKNINYQVQDATNLTYDDNMFDLVLIANALHIMPNPDKALKEIHRVLKEDGMLIAPTFVYEQKINKARLYIMEKIGFKTFYKWTSEEYSAFIKTHGFSINEKEFIHGRLLPECILVCKKT